MNELDNTATAVGNYNNISTSLTSNTSVVNLIDGLTLSMEADKVNWSDGLLTYTITLDNQTTLSYENPVIKDVLDTSKVEFVVDSVLIDQVQATSSEASYDSSSSTLQITLDEVGANSSKVISFKVKKKVS